MNPVIYPIFQLEACDYKYINQHQAEINTYFLKDIYYYISKFSNERSWSQNNVINFTITIFFLYYHNTIKSNQFSWQNKSFK